MYLLNIPGNEKQNKNKNKNLKKNETLNLTKLFYKTAILNISQYS